jgi:glucosylceramidase
VPCLKYSGGGQVVVSECLGSPDQSWTVEADGTIQANGLCLDTQGGLTASGTATVLATCDAQATQVWTYKSASGTLVNEGSGLCLDAPSVVNGTQTEIETCTARNTSQQWVLPTY